MMRRRQTSEMASCVQAMRRLNAYLDSQIDDPVEARRIAAHLDDCARCGLEAKTLTALKASLNRLAPQVDPIAVDRLREFALQIDG